MGVRAARAAINAIIISWAKKTPDIRAVFLRGSRAKGTAMPDSNVELALSIMSQDPLWRLANFLSRRRAWRAELEKSLSLAVQLERARGKPTPETGYVELWMRT